MTTPTTSAFNHPITAAEKSDPSDAPIVCEVCGKTVRLGDSYSFLLGWGTTGPENLAAFTCGGGKDANGQHFTCSKECCAKAGHACIEEHLLPLHAEYWSEKQQALAHINAIRASEKAMNDQRQG